MRACPRSCRHARPSLPRAFLRKNKDRYRRQMRTVVAATYRRFVAGPQRITD